MTARGPPNGRQGLERCLPIGLGAPANFCKISFLIRALLLWEKAATEEKRGEIPGKKKKRRIMKVVTTTPLPAVDHPDAERSCQKQPAWAHGFNLFWKICFASRDVDQNMPKFRLPNRTFIFWDILANILGPSANNWKPGMYILQVSLFFSQPSPTRIRFFPHLLLLFCVLRAHSDTFYGLKLAHSALKAQTKP